MKVGLMVATSTTHAAGGLEGGPRREGSDLDRYSFAPKFGLLIFSFVIFDFKASPPKEGGWAHYTPTRIDLSLAIRCGIQTPPHNPPLLLVGAASVPVLDVNLTSFTPTVLLIPAASEGGGLRISWGEEAEKDRCRGGSCIHPPGAN